MHNVAWCRDGPLPYWGILHGFSESKPLGLMGGGEEFSNFSPLGILEGKTGPLTWDADRGVVPLLGDPEYAYEDGMPCLKDNYITIATGVSLPQLGTQEQRQSQANNTLPASRPPPVHLDP